MATNRARNTKPAQLQQLLLLFVALLASFGPCGTLALDYKALCSNNTLTLKRNPGDSLQPQGNQTAVTFVLSAGAYTLDARVSVDAGATACYEAAPGAAVTIKRAAAFPSGSHLLSAGNGAKLGLKSITLDGSGSGPAAQAGGVAVATGATLAAQGTTIRNFHAGDGAGLSVSDASLYLTNVVLERNTADGGSGGGASLVYARAGSLNNVSFIANSAASGGGLFSMLSDPVIYSGLIRFVDNTATGQGGGVSIAGGVFALTGAGLCAAGNNAPSGGGGFAFVDGGATMKLGGKAQQNAGDNTDDAIVVAPSSAVTCASGSAASSWRRPGSNNVMGAVCGCTKAFAEGSAITCNTCGTLGWDAAACACAVPASISLQHKVAVACGQQLSLTAQALSTTGSPLKGAAVQIDIVEEADERNQKQGTAAAGAATAGGAKPGDVALVPGEGYATSAQPFVQQQLLLKSAGEPTAQQNSRRPLARTMAVTNEQGEATVVLTARAPGRKLTVLAAVAPGGSAPLLVAKSEVDVRGSALCGGN